MNIPSRTLIVGCGYLGVRVAEKLLSRGEAVFGTTRSPEKASRLSDLGIIPILVDITRPFPANELPEADRVLYCVGFDRKSGATIRDVYVAGLGQVLDALRGPIVRLVYVSSTSVYGQTGGEWVTEESPTVPITESGRACWEAEQCVARSRFPWSILRYSGLYGPGRIIGKTALEKGEPIAGNPDGWLNLIEIDDAAEAAIAVLDRGKAGRIYLASDDQPVLRRDYYETAARLLGTDPPRFASSPPSTPDRSDKRVSNQRLKEELGFRLRSPDIEEGLRRAVSVETP